MRALVLTGLREVSLLERPAPVAGPGEVVLEIDACGICGSDLHGFLGEEPRRRPGLCLGHECVGRIASPHPTLAIGTRVAVNPFHPCRCCETCLRGQSNVCPQRYLIGLDEVPGALAEQVTVAAGNVFALDSAVPDAVACLIEPLACAVHLLRLVPLPPLARLALFGCGTLGGLTLAVARRLGYRVAVIEPSAGRRQIALALGAEVAVDPVTPGLTAALGGPVGASLDCTGVSPARQQAVGVTAPGGSVLLLGTTATETTLDFKDVVRRELRLQASYGFTADDFATAQRLAGELSAELQPWCRSLPLAAGQAAFESLLPPPEDCLKVVLRPA
ncbi:MAG: alcohol dehydrogenase catalytic domain-containing protein [Fimbriimonadaceae bacterium]|nr:alcohol dehydrogenase catalytic domain-containing protein [Fimbriimonadaceae bacterium]